MNRHLSHTRDLPTGEHWVILTDRSIHIPGDERSRTNPGHGYPESTEHYVDYEMFEDEDAFKKELTERIKRDPKTTARGMHVMGVYEAYLEVELAYTK
jgi:hypothetical protein